MYGSWDMVHDRCSCLFLILGYFLHFYPLTTAQKIKIKKKWKKHLQISSFYISVPKIMIRWCTVPAIWCMIDVIVISHFGLFHPLTAQKIKILKKWKKHLEISPFYICVLQIMIRWCTVPEICCTTDGQTEKVTYKGGCPT